MTLFNIIIMEINDTVVYKHGWYIDMVHLKLYVFNLVY